MTSLRYLCGALAATGSVIQAVSAQDVAADELAARAVATTSTASPATATATASKFPVIPVPSGTFDYIVVGGGAAGIPVVDRLSEAGKSTLLIERGPGATGQWGGTIRPDWLANTNLTEFDVPGLCDEIWLNRTGVACTDIDQMAGCVLGGGTAINSGLWWNPNPIDWDYNFPAGWQAKDMAESTQMVFSRIPGTYNSSMDGKRYLQQGEDLLSAGLAQGGWEKVAANSAPGSKNKTFSHIPFMFSGGERAGPLATYLVTAAARKNFQMWQRTTVKRVIRNGGHVTGVEVEPYISGGYTGIVNVTTTTGRVILSAGVFGTSKILMRSGIGPADSLAVVKNSTIDGPTMIDSKDWIDLPVGKNLEDHTNTYITFSHPDIVGYDFYGAYNNPIPTDADLYLTNRSGILAIAAPNIGPGFWDVIPGADGIDRQLQYTASPSNGSMSMSQYLGRGAVSRGRANILPNLNMTVSELPYLRDPNDVAAVIKGIENLQQALSGVKNLTWVAPPQGVSAADFINNMTITTATRGANHWIGTAKLGLDDGRKGGSAVVDLNTLVYGTNNLFVVDASIFPGMVSTNPSALIVIAAEHAVARIKALPTPTAAAKPSTNAAPGRSRGLVGALVALVRRTGTAVLGAAGAFEL